MNQAIQEANPPVAAIRPRDRDQLFQALRAGVVPRAGIRHVQVGRVREIQEVARDLDRIAENGTAFRVIVGAYGSGKTFFLNLAKAAAQEKRLVTVSADLSPEKRLHSSGGQARALLAELAKSMATRAKPEGGALESILQRLIMDARDAAGAGGDVKSVIEDKLRPILDLSGGYDAVQVVRHYAAADEAGDSDAKDAALRWLRAEYSTRTEARSRLPIRDIPDDSRFWDHLKILAAITRAAGYAGLLVCVDECVNLYKIQSSQSRSSNYEEILRILNDLLQGGAAGIGMMLGGTPEFLMDGRRGLHSYEALRSRLAENTFQAGGLLDLSGPVIRLQNLSPEDMWVLLTRLRAAWLSDASQRVDLPDAALEAFTAHCRTKIGAAWFQTPRATIRAFVDLLEILRQNPDAHWSTVLSKVAVNPDQQAIADEEATAQQPAAAHPTPPATTVIAPAAMPPHSLPETRTETPTETPAPALTETQGEKTAPAIRDGRDDDLASFKL